MAEHGEQPVIARGMPARVWIAVAVIVLIAIGAYAGLQGLLKAERERDLRTWQTHMGIIASSRVSALQTWLEIQYGHLTELADNASLQNYATDILEASGDPVKLEQILSVEGVYFINLLQVVAHRGGFVSELSGPDVDANVSRVGAAGIALLDNKGRPVIATRSMPPVEDMLKENTAVLSGNERSLIDLHIGVKGTATAGFAVSVFAVHDDKSGAERLGTLLGIKEIEEELFILLEHPGSVEATAEFTLVRKSGNLVEYLSPLQDGTVALNHVMDVNTPSLAAAFAINHPGGFAIRQDYRNKEVLVISRNVPGTPWVFMYKIDTEEALSASDQRLRSIQISGVLLTAFVIVLIIAFWRWGTSIRVERALKETSKALARHQNLSKFLRVMADHQLAQVFAVTRDGVYTFANQIAAENANMTPDDMMGKSMFATLGPVRAKAFTATNEGVMENHLPETRIYDFEEQDGAKIYRVSHVPLKGDQDYPPGVLMVMDDLTGFLSEHRDRKSALRKLAGVLAAIADQKDRYVMLHTALVAEIAAGIAMALELPEEERETIDLVALLVDLGKSFVPEDTLLKPAELDDSERGLIETSKQAAIRILEGIDFGLPVHEALSQIYEHWDGSGSPDGLKGDDILMAARVIAVAHTFVAIVSQRAYREALSIEQSTDIIMADADVKFDRQVVMALVHYLENRGGRALFAKLSEVDYDDPLAQIRLYQDITSDRQFT